MEQTVRRVVKKEDEFADIAKAHLYEETPDYLFEAKSNYTNAEEDLVKFVNAQMDKMQASLLFNQTPSFSQLQDSLANYESNLFMLLTLYSVARSSAAIANEVYDDKWATCVMKAKTELGLTKYTSGKELEYIARTQNMKELSRLKADIILTENKLALINHLIDSWKQYSYVLGQLSRNAQAEIGASFNSNNDRIGNYLGDSPDGN